jgi:hypothetical protein
MMEGRLLPVQRHQKEQRASAMAGQILLRARARIMTNR